MKTATHTTQFKLRKTIVTRFANTHSTNKMGTSTIIATSSIYSARPASF